MSIKASCAVVSVSWYGCPAAAASFDSSDEETIEQA